VRRLALLASILLAAPVHAGDKTLLIELDRRFRTFPTAVNPAGSMFVGSLDPGGAFYWMPTTGVIEVGGVGASGVSADGATIVGSALDRQLVQNAAIWTRGEWRLLGSFTNAVGCDRSLSSGTGISRDGAVVVGLAFRGCTGYAFRWSESTGMVDLGSAFAGQFSRAIGVSGDGNVVVGGQESQTGPIIGSRWLQGRQELFTGPTGQVGEARGVNGDGSVVVGRQCKPADPFDQSAWVFTAGAGVQCLPAPARMVSREFVVITEANATSDDGRVIGGGQSAGGPGNSEAILWLNGSPAYLKDFLRANGVPDAFATYINTGEITDVSPDGRILVGWGAALGGFRGYIVILGDKLVMP
jgi:probable HAF family extracellular repeat protein